MVFILCFGWKLSLWFRTKQFWSVPFVNDKKEKNIRVVLNDIRNDLRTKMFSNIKQLCKIINYVKKFNTNDYLIRIRYLLFFLVWSS